MKAFVLKQNGGIENLELTDLYIPSIRNDEVLVRVKAISINPVDAYLRKNDQAMEAVMKPRKGDRIILGWDISGTVERAGVDVTILQEGDEVFGMVNFPGHGRAYAEYVAAPADQLTKKPEYSSHEEAAAACLAALTAWQALVTYANVKKGERVLIHAAAGGVGHYAVQMAKYFGAEVTGTASGENRDFVLSLGANEFIDYTTEKFEEKAKEMDIVLDSIYGDHVFRSLESLKRGGRLITLLAPVTGETGSRARDKDVFAHHLGVVSNGEDMKQIAMLLENGNLKSTISQTYKFEDLPKSHLQIETGKTRGKLIVKV